MRDLGRGDEVDRDLMHALESIGFLEKHSFDRFLPLFNVATNISTKIGYNKFCFVLLLRRLVLDDRCFLRLFAVRVFRDEEAQMVRDILEPVRDSILRRIIGGNFGSFFNRINHNEALSGSWSHECDGDALADFIAKHWRRQTNTSEAPLVRFPNIFVYIINPSANKSGLFLNSTLTNEQIGTKSEILHSLFSARDDYERLLRLRISDPKFRRRERVILSHLALKMGRKSKRKKEIEVESVFAENDCRLKEQLQASASLLNDSCEYWNGKLESSTTEDQHPSISFDYTSQDRFLHTLEEDMDSEQSYKNSPNHNSFYEFTRNKKNSAAAHYFFEDKQSNKPFTKSFDFEAKKRCDHDLITVWLKAFNCVDSNLWNEKRLEFEYPSEDSALLATVCASAVHSIALQVFLARNKLNDIIRLCVVNSNPQKYRRELENAKNFASFLDFSEFINLDNCVKHYQRLFEDKVYLPLEWIDSELVTEALNAWSHSRLDVRFCPLEPFDELRYIDLHPSDETIEMQRWFKHAQNMFASVPSDINSREVNSARRSSETEKQEDKYVSPADFARFLRSKQEQVSDEVVRNSLEHEFSSPFFDIFCKKRKLAENNRFSKRVKPSTTAWLVYLYDKFYDFSSDNESFIYVYCLNKFPRNTGCFTRWSDTDENTVPSTVSTSKVSTDMAKHVEALLSHWKKNGLDTETEQDTKPQHTKPATIIQPDEKVNRNETTVKHVILSATQQVESLLQHWKKIEKQPNENDNSEEDMEEKIHTSFSERTFRSKEPYNPFNAFLTNYADYNSPEESIEQLLFIQLFLDCADADFSILVNGNPGSGKTTVMNFLNELLEHNTLNLLPTNVLRERTKIRLERQSGGDFSPIVLTLSSFIKRSLRYNMSPDMYSRIIERYLAEQLQRMLLTVRPMSVDRYLNPLCSPVGTLQYPPLVQVDEYNLCNFAEMELVSQVCRTLRCLRVCYGDFAQGTPIRGTMDNAELIVLRASLMVQFMDNKRLVRSNSGMDTNGERTTSGETKVRLAKLLADPVWNWRGNNCEDGITEYVRRLIDDCICKPLRARQEKRSTLSSKLRENVGDEFRSERCIRLNEEQLSNWYACTTELMNWYDERPCRRYVRTKRTLFELARRITPLPLPCVISRRNYESDRINQLVSTAIRDFIDQSCSDSAIRATANSPRSTYQPACFYLIARRSCLATEASLSNNASWVKQDQLPSLPQTISEPNIFPPSDSIINDDPWCSNLTLIIGAVYRFIGKWPGVLSSDSLLRLIAFLPAEKRSKKNKKNEPREYLCDGKGDCDAGCDRVLEQQKLLRKIVQPRSTSVTLGCGSVHTDTKLKFSAPRLLMRRVTTRDDDDKNKPFEPQDFFVIDRTCFELSRCNSLWTPNMYTLNCARSGMVLYGYPLVLNCGISSWRVQGETIPKSEVYVDLRNMTRQQALVSLSRVRHHEQIQGVINLRFYAGGAFETTPIEEKIAEEAHEVQLSSHTL